MKIFLSISLIATLYCSASFSATEKIIIASEDSAGPWGNQDGQGAGNEIVKEAFSAMNVEVELRVMPYKRAKIQVISGHIAACFAMSFGPELEGKVVFSKEPLYKVNADFFTNVSNINSAKSLDELKTGSTVGLVAGYEYPNSVDGLKKRSIFLEEGRSEESNLKRLAFNRLNYIVIMTDDLKTGESLLAKTNMTNKIKMAFRSEAQGSYIGFSLANPQGQYAKEKFDQGFAIIKKNGTYAKILNKWQTKTTADSRARMNYLSKL